MVTEDSLKKKKKKITADKVSRKGGKREKKKKKKGALASLPGSRLPAPARRPGLRREDRKSTSGCHLR